MTRTWKRAVAMAVLLTISLTSLAFGGEVPGGLRRPTVGQATTRRLVPRSVDLAADVVAVRLDSGTVIPDGAVVPPGVEVCISFLITNHGTSRVATSYQRKVVSGRRLVLSPGVERTVLDPGQTRVIAYRFLPGSWQTSASLWVDQTEFGPGVIQESNENNNRSGCNFTR